jgi:hypothetical protein
MVSRLFRDGAKRWILWTQFAVLGGMLLFGFFGAIIYRHGADERFGIEFGAGGLIFVTIFHANLFFRTSDVLADDDGLAYIFYGKEVKRVHWKDVKRIRLRNYGQNPDVDIIRQGRIPMTCYCVDVSDRQWLYWKKDGPLLFSDRTPEKRELLDIINEHVRAQGIPVLDYREGRKGTPLPALPQPEPLPSEST